MNHLHLQIQESEKVVGVPYNDMGSLCSGIVNYKQLCKLQWYSYLVMLTFNSFSFVAMCRWRSTK